MTSMPPRIERIPPLCNGDHLSAAEFMRRYKAMPDVKAELIEGVVFVPSPVTFTRHGEPHFDFQTWVGIYKFNTPGVRAGDNSTLVLPTGINIVQPDTALFVLGKRCWINDDGYLEGTPQWIGEVSASSSSYDLHEKLGGYERSQVREYVVWRVDDEVVDWFVLRGGVFKRMRRSADGLYKSKVFPGLWLDADALIQGDNQRLVKALQKGLAAPQHKAFVRKLQGKGRKDNA